MLTNDDTDVNRDGAREMRVTQFSLPVNCQRQEKTHKKSLQQSS